MKNLSIFIVLCFCNLTFSQSNEFKVEDNGLIYSKEAITKLQKIVDSLNLKFKVCNSNPTFKSVNQTKAHFITLDKSKVKDALVDLKNNITFEEFVRKYPKANLDKNLIVIKSIYYDEYDKKKKLEINSLKLNNEYHSIDKNIEEVNSFITNSVKGKWLYEYAEKTNYSDERVEAFYFIDDFVSKPIPKKYSKWIEYSECMVDTAATVFLNNSRESGVRYNFDTIPRKYQAFNKYVDVVLKRPSFSDEKLQSVFGFDTMNYEKPWKKLKLSKKEKIKIEERRKLAENDFEQFQNIMKVWESKRLIRLDSLSVNDSKFMTSLNDAYEESKTIKSSDDEFEEYVARYLSKESALEMKRNRRVIGGCSMDISPRIHAVNIALLSAETIKWEIFLRSHLDIMNDRFDRVSDGSYAYADRNTYIRELEVLNFDVMELILGITLRFENPVENHYFGSISRVGRAISESNNTVTFEQNILEMISNSELDDYNRILMYFLFDNYNHYLKDERLKTENFQKLKNAVSTMPDYIASRIEVKE